MSSTEPIHHVCGLKESDLNEFFLAYDPEFNKEDLHDRVLVFGIIKDQRQTNINPILNDKRETYSIAGEVILPCVEGGLNLNLKEIEVISEEVKVSDRKRHLDDAEQQQYTNLKKSRAEYESDIDENKGTAVLVQVETTSDGNDKQCTSENMTENTAGSDFVNSDPVSVREHKIFVHATFLAVHSKYFRAMFYSGMKEAKSKEVHIWIHESEEQSHLKMLEAIYRPYILDNSTVEELLQILELADKYDVTYVFRKCIYLIEKCSLNIVDCEMILNCIEIKKKIPSTSELAATVREYVASEFSPLDTNWENEKFTNLSEAMLRVLLSCKNLKTQSENTVFHALMYWIISTGYDYHIIPKGTESILSLVRFELLTIDYLYHVVQDHHIAKEMPSFSDLYLKGITYHALPSSMKRNVITRPEPAESTLQYMWVITKDELIKALLNGKSGETEGESNPASDSCLISSRFWWCGYEMQMNMSLTQYMGYLCGKLHLLVHGLKKRSRLPVRWLTICEEIQAKPCTATFCFEKKTSEVDVKIRKHRENGRFVLPQAITIGICIIHDPSKL